MSLSIHGGVDRSCQQLRFLIPHLWTEAKGPAQSFVAQDRCGWNVSTSSLRDDARVDESDVKALQR